MHPDQLPPALQTVITTVVKTERRRARKQAENARREVYAALGEVFIKSLPALFSKAAQHAPAGGVTVQGKEYVGGQFIPADVMAEATAEERAAVEGKAADRPAEDADPDRKAITDRLDGFSTAADLEAEHDDLHEELHERMLAAEDDDEADRLADLIAFADEELERLKQEMADSDVQVMEDDDTGDTARDELAAGEWHPVHTDDWLSEDAWPHEDPSEAAWDFRKSQAANRARFEKQLTAQTAADAAQVADFAAQAEARVKDLTGDDTDAATVREFAKDARTAIEDATSEYTAAAADYYDADKEAYKAEQKVPDGAMSTADIDALESAADRYREMRLKAAEKLPPAERDAEVERIEQQHEKRLSGVDRRAAKLKDKADQLAAVRDEQAARYESARTAYATTVREQVAAIQSAVADIANGFTGRTAKSITRFAKSLALGLQLEDLKEGVRRGVTADVWAWNDLLASVGDELGLERVTKADRSHLVRKVIRNRLGNRQVIWVNPNKGGGKADRGVPVGEDGKPTEEKPQPVAKTREQLAESRSVLAAAVNDPDRLNPEQVRKLADHIDSITKDEAKGLLKQLGQKVSGDQMAVAGRLLEAIRAGRGAGGVGEALRRAGNKTTGQYGAWGQAAGGGERPVSRDTLPKRGVGPGELQPASNPEAIGKQSGDQKNVIDTPVGQVELDAKVVPTALPEQPRTVGTGEQPWDVLEQREGESRAEYIKRVESSAPKAKQTRSPTAEEAATIRDELRAAGIPVSVKNIKTARGSSLDIQRADRSNQVFSVEEQNKIREVLRRRGGVSGFDGKHMHPVDYQSSRVANVVMDADGPHPDYAQQPDTIDGKPAWATSVDKYTATHPLAERIQRASLSQGTGNNSADIARRVRREHRDRVERALEADKPVPADVLKDYPDLAKEYDQQAGGITPAEFDRRMESIDPRDSGNVEVPEPVRPLEPDERDAERYDAARERLDRMRWWQADKPDDLRAEEQVRRAEGRLREVVGEEGEPRREPVPRPVAGGPRPVAELTDAEIEAERRALPRNRRTQAQYERDLELSRESARRNPIPPGGGTPFPLLGGGPGPGSNDRSDERTAQPPAARQNYQTLRKQAAEGMAAGAAAMQQPHDGSGLPDIPLYAPLSAEQRADLDAQRRAAKTRQEARGVELLASQMAAEAESARRSDAARAERTSPQSPASAVDNTAPVGNTTPVQPQPAGANQGGGGMQATASKVNVAKVQPTPFVSRSEVTKSVDGKWVSIPVVASAGASEVKFGDDTIKLRQPLMASATIDEDDGGVYVTLGVVAGKQDKQELFRRGVQDLPKKKVYVVGGDGTASPDLAATVASLKAITDPVGRKSAEEIIRTLREELGVVEGR